MTALAPDLAATISTSPAFGLGLSVGAYALVLAVSRLLGSPPWANPVLWTVVITGSVLLLTRVDYADYLIGGGLISALLGPAVVALAVPPHLNARLVRPALPGSLLAALVGSACGIVVTVVVAGLLGATPETVLALAPKSATGPVALAITDLLGGPGELAAVLAILTGILGASAGPALLTLFHVTDPRSRGLAIGVSAHAIGTARAFEEGDVTGAFSVVGMVLAAVVVAVLVPGLVALYPALAG